MNPDTICGLNAVSALFARRPADVLRLFYVPDLRHRVGSFCSALAQAHKPYRMVSPEDLATISGTTHHGGAAAVAHPRRVTPLDPQRPPLVPLLLVLDGVGNPHNLGAIARSAAFFGVRALVMSDAGALPSDAAYRTAEGGLEHLDLYRARDLASALGSLAPHYRRVAAVSAADAVPIGDLPRDRPIALVLGHEERGVSPAVLAVCRRHVRIAGSGRVESLNVAQSAAVMLHLLAP